MEIWAWVQVYGIVASALAGTSYFTLYRPGVELAEEILDEDLNLHRGWLGTTMWLLISASLAPYTLFTLLKNDNAEFIEGFAVALADRIMKDEDEDG
jgi:hypothetical protein